MTNMNLLRRQLGTHQIENLEKNPLDRDVIWPCSIPTRELGQRKRLRVLMT
jgi:hypothetical protein